MKKRVGVIGAGISGLLACKHVLQKGFVPVVFEATGEVGGVWSRTLESTKLQSPRVAFQFSDFPWPEDVVEEYPLGGQARDYVHAYARRFDLMRYVRLHARVVAAEFVGPEEEEMRAWALWAGTGDAFGGPTTRGVWHITTRDDANGEEAHEVDFMILCVGKFGGLPNIPSFPPTKGPEVFQGVVMHSMDLYNMDDDNLRELLKNKRVTVIGFLKTALDIAAMCADWNGVDCPCMMVYRSNHWHLVDPYAWGVNIGLFYQNRFSELFFHKPGEGFLLFTLAMLLSPLRWVFSKLVECSLKWRLPLQKYGTVPDQSLFQDFASASIAILPDKFYDRVEEGSIILRKSEHFSFRETGILTDNGALIETDILIFATGFKGDQKIKNIFTSSSFKEIIMGTSSTTVPLYRECIHPRIPQLAIIGYSESFNNLYTSEIRCKWLANFLEGNFKLPSIASMEMDIKEWEKYMKSYLKQNFRKSSIATIHTWYSDQLCKDMGYNPRRKKGLVDWLIPYTSTDYKDIP